METLVYARVAPPLTAAPLVVLPATMIPKPASIVVVFELRRRADCCAMRSDWWAGGPWRRKSCRKLFCACTSVGPRWKIPGAWLYRSVRNLAINHLRDRKPESELKDDTAASDDSPTPEVMGKNEAIGMMRLLLAEMSEEDKTLLQLKYHDDLRYQDISLRTGLSVSNVGYRLHHVLKGLADALRHAGIEGSRG